MTLVTLGDPGISPSQGRGDSHQTNSGKTEATLATLGRGADTLQRKFRKGGQSAVTEGIPLPGPMDDLGPWPPFLAELETHLRVCGFARRTIPGYVCAARRFSFWLLRRGIVTPSSITPDLCMAFQRAVYFHVTPRGTPNPTNSQRGMLTGVRRFTEFLKKRGYSLVDTGLAITMPRPPKRLPRELPTEEEMTRLLMAPDVGTLRGYRDRTMIEVLYATGMRSSELMKLDVDDVDLENGRAHIREGKGGKDRMVPLGDVATEYVAGYVANIRPRLVRNSAERALFTGWCGRRMTHPDRVIHAVRRHLKSAGIEKPMVLHTFRHTCATHMLKHGAGIRHIQELLGHSSLTTTEQYTKVEIGDLSKVHDEFHPRRTL